jgi:hypothetical protein
MSETPIPAEMPGHSAGTARIRLQPCFRSDGFIDGYNDGWELICPACGDDERGYADVPPKIQAIRGPYPDEESAWVALQVHIGLENDDTRAARGDW